MRASCRLHLIHAGTVGSRSPSTPKVTVKAWREFFTKSASANSSRVEASEVSGVSKTIWQLGTNAEILATRK